MYAHPVTPNCIKSFYLNDWNIDTSCTDDHGRIDLRSFYGDLCEAAESRRSRKRRALENLNEINIYLQKFIRFLIDGVPVRYLVQDDTHTIEMNKLCLVYQAGSELDEPFMKLVFMNKEFPDEEKEIEMNDITSISKSYPIENNKRLLCISADQDSVFFTRNDADHVLLSCGLKILLEKVVSRKIHLF